jgi:type VI secretion system protein ImpC
MIAMTCGRPVAVILPRSKELPMPQARNELPFVIGVLADLSGRAARESLEQRRFMTIDRENFNDVMERVGPRARFEARNVLGGPGTLGIDLTFKSLDDFGPDAVASAVGPLRQLLAERRKFINAPTASMTDAELQEALRRTLAANAPQAGRPEESGGEPAGFLEQVLDRTGPAEAEQTAAPASAPARLPAGASAVQRIDRLLSEQVDSILHHAEFRALEATWRGLWHLVFNVETGAELVIRVLDLPRAELARALADPSLAEDEQAALVKLVYSEAFERPDGVPFGLLIGDYEFDARSAEVLGVLALLTAAACVPLIGCAGAGLFGGERWSDLELASGAPTRRESPAWEALRHADETRFVFLAAPRLLARYPYGQKYTAAETFAFEEDAPPEDAAKQLWMNPAYALGALAARAYAESGRPGAIRESQQAATVSRLPVLPLGEDARQAHCLEALLGRHADVALREAGVIPLLLSPAADGRAFVAAAPSLYRMDGKSSELAEVLDACREAHEKR